MCDWYEVQGHRFGVRSTSEAFGMWLRYVLGAQRIRPTLEEEELPTYSIVVEDGTSSRLGRGYHILYVGTMDVVRTFDLRFLARSFLHEIDMLGASERRDALFLRAGVVEADGQVALLPPILVPVLNAVRRRALRRGMDAPGGSVAALDLGSGELISPVPSVGVPTDAIDLLERYVPGATNGARDRFPIETGARRPLDVVIGLDIRQAELSNERPRSETAIELAMAAVNMHRVGGSGFTAIGKAVGGARSVTLNWSSTDQMFDALAVAMHPDDDGVRIEP